jgi:hypothetical protein
MPRCKPGEPRAGSFDGNPAWKSGSCFSYFYRFLRIRGKASLRRNPMRPAGSLSTWSSRINLKSRYPACNSRISRFWTTNNRRKFFHFKRWGGAAAASPLEIVFLIDRVNTSFQSAASEREQTKKFLSQNGGILAQPVLMVFFADSGTSMQPATRDGNALIAALERSDNSLRTSRGSQGIYGADDRFQLSLRALNSLAAYEEKIPGRKMLIWISPGWPLLSGPGVQLSSKDQQGLFNAIVAASNALLEARITLLQH